MNLPVKRKDIELRIHGLRDTLESIEPHERFPLLDDAVESSSRAKEIAGLYLAASLALAKIYWSSIPLEHTSQWGYDFNQYAHERTGGYACSTIDNLINVGNTFLLNTPKSIPETVKLYDSNGKALDRTIVPDVYSLNVSKLLVASGATKDGRLEKDPVAMGQLFNPEVSVHTFHRTLCKSKAEAPIINGKLCLRLDGPFIIAEKLGNEEIVARINQDGGELVREAVKYLVAACRITE